MAADLVEAMTGQAEDVDVHFELPDDVRVAVDHARATTAEAKRLASVAADEYREAVRDLVVDRGMSKADVAALLQVSRQRLSQLATGTEGHRGAVYGYQSMAFSNDRTGRTVVMTGTMLPPRPLPRLRSPPQQISPCAGRRPTRVTPRPRQQQGDPSLRTAFGQPGPVAPSTASSV